MLCKRPAVSKKKKAISSVGPPAAGGRRRKATTTSPSTQIFIPSAASSLAIVTATSTALVIANDPVFKDVNAADLLKLHTPLQLLGLTSEHRTSLVSSDESEGLCGWTEQNEERWPPCLVEGQEETRNQTFVIDELLRWRAREQPRGRGVQQYRGAWLKYSIYDCTWEPAASFDTETLAEFWARERGRPSHVPAPTFDDERYLAHGSDTNFPTFNDLDAGQARAKVDKKCTAWRRDKRDLSFVKQLKKTGRRSARRANSTAQ
ncbi:hypothetical protein CF319_g7129 [Tilletia indica]|nr:hypothetical protein CF319_g7129 [Tilletia indica]KAE8227775.1 hypothetical protein CF326_g7317 [Tilletia indica]